MNQNKRQYTKPSIKVIKLLHRASVLTSSVPFAPNTPNPDQW